MQLISDSGRYSGIKILTMQDLVFLCYIFLNKDIQVTLISDRPQKYCCQAFSAAIPPAIFNELHLGVD